MPMKFEDYKQYLSPVFYKQTNLVAKTAKGCYITDVNGDRYLDFVQGIAVMQWDITIHPLSRPFRIRPDSL